MLEHARYFPVLRWKRGEWNALAAVSREHCSYMTPIFEVTPKAFANRKPSSARVRKSDLTGTAEDILQYWGADPLFLDLHLLDPDARVGSSLHPLSFYAQGARDRQLHLVPVIGLASDQACRTAARAINAADGHGVCVRILGNEVSSGSFERGLLQILGDLDITPRETDIMVDLQLISEASPSFAEICGRIPDLIGWRTFTIINGGFPKNLAKLERNRQHQIPRSDWENWRAQVIGSKLLRLPAFGDYTIQHPFFSEAPDNPNISASIRYTAAQYWVVMRGEGLRNVDGPGYEQYRAQAQLLCKRTEFCGEGFSSGDEYIRQLSLGTNGKGSPETLIRAGINHHLTFVVTQISTLFGSGAVGAP